MFIFSSACVGRREYICMIHEKRNKREMHRTYGYESGLRQEGQMYGDHKNRRVMYDDHTSESSQHTTMYQLSSQPSTPRRHHPPRSSHEVGKQRSEGPRS